MGSIILPGPLIGSEMKPKSYISVGVSMPNIEFLRANIRVHLACKLSCPSTVTNPFRFENLFKFGGVLF